MRLPVFGDDFLDVGDGFLFPSGGDVPPEDPVLSRRDFDVRAMSGDRFLEAVAGDDAVVAASGLLPVRFFALLDFLGAATSGAAIDPRRSTTVRAGVTTEAGDSSPPVAASDVTEPRLRRLSITACASAAVNVLFALVSGESTTVAGFAFFFLDEE